MRISALNATYRLEGTTTRLVRRALDGAASLGASTQMILLGEQNIQFCRNCLTCYSDLDSEIASCVIEDDVRGILEAITCGLPGSHGVCDRSHGHVHGASLLDRRVEAQIVMGDAAKA
jgi:hypothetical protein